MTQLLPFLITVASQAILLHIVCLVRAAWPMVVLLTLTFIGLLLITIVNLVGLIAVNRAHILFLTVPELALVTIGWLAIR